MPNKTTIYKSEIDFVFPSYYAIITADVRYNDNLCANAKLMYGEITALSNKNGYCNASNGYFANLYGVSNVSISKWIKSLIDEGYIESVLEYYPGTRQISNRYITLVNGGIKEKFNRGIKEKFKDNNTSNNNTRVNNISKDIYNDFEIFWNDYHSITGLPKTDKEPAFKYFKQLTKKEQLAAAENIRKYADTIQDIKYCKKARTYLSSKTFNDEFTTKSIFKA